MNSHAYSKQTKGMSKTSQMSELSTFERKTQTNEKEREGV